MRTRQNGRKFPVKGDSQTPLVAHIIYALGTGGLENGLVNIINRAPRKRYRHAIICLTDADDFASRITAPGVEIIQLHKKPGHDIRLYWRLLKTLKRLKPVIVHTRNLTSLEMQALTFFLPGVRRIHGEHGRDIHDLDGSNRKYNFLRKVFRPFIHCYIAVSHDLGQWLKTVVGVPSEKVKQIYNGVDIERFLPAAHKNAALLPANFLPRDAIVIGAVGRIAEVKNQRSLILAVDQVLKAKPELVDRLRVMLVGDGPLLAGIKTLVSDLRLSDIIWLPGDRTDIPQLLQQMDIFVLPSLAEGVSNTVLEAMATGLPVIATRVGGNPELVEEDVNGLLVDVDDSQQLAKALLKLIEQPELRQGLGQQGLKKVSETFNWQKTVAQYLAVYDEVLQTERKK
ncbi:MAG: TIGR03088 family PEP-CTERM/XrtA system glycosyltransferase [Pseudomonadales bacterium]|nr:TIGR03088 family PEP-CTERM/XrtA system glycosyltransferase [Pseudomonadales bacterium]MCP5302157.1 TIGR03088 family PEP-CTERM/XrtA system glycosyltransferase [Pseudomonadales bacterium]